MYEHVLLFQKRFPARLLMFCDPDRALEDKNAQIKYL